MPDGDNYQRFTALYKIAQSTDAGLGISVGSSSRNCLVVFRGNRPIVAASLQSLTTAFQETNPTSKTITSASGNSPLVALGLYGGATGRTVSPRTMTPAKDSEVGAGNGWIAWKIYNTAPADVVIDMDDEGEYNFLTGCYFDLS